MRMPAGTKPVTTDDIWINPRRPSIFNDADRDMWKKFQTVVKESPVQVWVNGMFDFIEDIIAKNECYGGGGFNYMFWFGTPTARLDFVRHVEEVWPNFSEPWMYPDLERVLVKTERMEDFGGYDKNWYTYTSKTHDQVAALRA